METIKLLVLSIVQGITELLPVSSSAHLILLNEVMKLPTSNLLLTSFHIGTTLAIIVFFSKRLFSNFFTKEKWIFYSKLLLAMIPAGILGVLFEDKIAEILRANWIMAISLIFWGILMIVAQRVDLGNKAEKWEKITWKQALLMGWGQTLALIPGTSRSGITTLTGISLGLNQFTALEYSFILGIPALAGSAAWEIIKTIHSNPAIISNGFTLEQYVQAGIIVIVPFVIGLGALALLKKLSKTKWLSTFGIYRIMLGIVILVVSYIL